MTNLRPIRISQAKAESGSISTRSYAFVFSDDITHWMKSQQVKTSEYAKRAYHKKK